MCSDTICDFYSFLDIFRVNTKCAFFFNLRKHVCHALPYRKNILKSTCYVPTKKISLYIFNAT